MLSSACVSYGGFPSQPPKQYKPIIPYVRICARPSIRQRQVRSSKGERESVLQWMCLVEKGEGHFAMSVDGQHRYWTLIGNNLCCPRGSNVLSKPIEASPPSAS